MNNLLERWAAEDVWAIGEREVGGADLINAVDGLTGRLAAAGVGPRSTVAIQLPPSFTLLQTLMAVWRHDAQAVLLDVRLKPAESDPLLRLCRPQHLITSPDHGDPAPFRDQCAITVTPRPDGVPATPEACLLQVSSGSTGRPKVVGRSRQSLREELERYSAMPGYTVVGERILVLSSIIHTWGLIGGFLHALYTGATLVLPTSLRPRDIVDTAKRTDVAVIIGVPVHFDLMGLAPADAGPLPTLRMPISAGETMTVETYDRFHRRFGCTVRQLYGMTEMGVVAADLSGTVRPPGVGRPAPGIRVRVVDGELQIARATTPYVHADRSGRWADGWLRTFDRGEVGPDGDLVVMGRADSMVAIGGLKVDLTEVEAVLAEYPSVTAAVVAFADVIEAYVAVSDETSPAVLMNWCRERLSDFKIPKRFHVAEALPRTVNGKVIRDRERLHAGLGQQ